MQNVHLKMVIPPGPWTRAMADGTITIPGVSWECVTDIGHTPDRFTATKRADVGENGVRHLALDVEKGAAPLALPVFFGREHMQRNIIVREDSPLSDPRELAGKRVGTRHSMVAGTMVGVTLMLEQAFDVPLADIEWHSGEPEGLVHNPMGLTIKRGPRAVGENLERLLRREVDAVIVTAGPRYWSMFGGHNLDQVLAGRSNMRSLIGAPEMIAATYKRMGLYPITDLGVVSADLPRLHPELPPRLVEAFSKANDLALRYRGSQEESLAHREIELLGEDPHRYGLTDNARRNVGALLDLLTRLGVLGRVMEPEELFVSSTLGTI
jgi:4,5-dihydroxyphthalate decarboxylase